MNKEIAIRQATPTSMTPEQVDLIKTTICKDATDEELNLFLYQCKRSGLDPLSRQIYFQKYRDNSTGRSVMTIITGVDGYRTIAARTGQYAGSDDPIFDNEENPKKATVTVYRITQGEKCSFTASARWDQYCPSNEKKAFMWRKMPHLMLGKCAEALALRKAFPDVLSNIYVREEMEQADESPIQIPVEIYNGTAAQNSKIKEWCEAHGVQVDDKRKIKQAISGKSMLEVENIVASFGKKSGEVVDEFPT